MAIGNIQGPSWAGLSIVLWAASIALSLVVYVMLLVPISPKYGSLSQVSLFFVIGPVVEGFSLALATSAFGAAWRAGFRNAITYSAWTLFALATAFTAFASYAYFTTVTCAGGLSGPCFTPFEFCGLGLLYAIGAAVASSVGIVRLSRLRSAPIPPPES